VTIPQMYQRARRRVAALTPKSAYAKRLGPTWWLEALMVYDAFKYRG
jgi:hypothetical protein